MEMDRDIALLKIRNLVADKEWATACANRQTEECGSWSCDHFEKVKEDEEELASLFEHVDKLTKQRRREAEAGFSLRLDGNHGENYCILGEKG